VKKKSREVERNFKKEPSSEKKGNFPCYVGKTRGGGGWELNGCDVETLVKDQRAVKGGVGDKKILKGRRKNKKPTKGGKKRNNA